MENEKEKVTKPKNANDKVRKTEKRSIARSHSTKPFPVVAIGGSAGSFQSFEKFLMHMPSDSGMAFVIIMHLDPHHIVNVSELIQAFSTMPVWEAEDGMIVKPDHVYVIPPNKDMGIHNRKLLLLSQSKARGYRLPIDYFLQSLAEDQWNKAVAIILSGMGSDGETGVRMIKQNLGMAMVQDPETAQYESMPKASIGTNMVDYVLSPEEMPVKLLQYLNHPAISEDPADYVKSSIRNDNAVQKILMLLRSHTGNDFSQYKKSTITRRIDRRIAFYQLPDYNHYINHLRENPSEIDTLFSELLIGVTKFVRDAGCFVSLKEKLFPIVQQKTDNEPIRIWVTACSTGEEAYSIAMVLLEIFTELKLKRLPKVQIFATDLDMEAIEVARKGIYLSNIIADVSVERLDRFFIKKNETYEVKKEMREMVVFAQHNIIKDAPFTRLDLLSCRNVMIYLNADLQKKVIPIFHYALNPTGLLLLGPAESIGGYVDLFSPLDAKWKIFERREGSVSTGRMANFSFNVAKQPNLISKNEEIKTVRRKSLADNLNRFLLETYTPVSVLTTDNGDILYVNGKTGKFLELNTGEAAMNIFEVIKEELKYVLRNAIHQARAQKNAVTVNDIKIKEDNQTRLVNIKVSFPDDLELKGFILIIFEDKGLLKKASSPKKNQNQQTNLAVEDLEKELDYTKQQLHNTVEQMETSLEELKSSNEELQSTNEELQSTNEESLTTKEEMQSLNEELMTVNAAYQIKAEELSRLNDDMKNLLDCTEIGTIFLDNQLRILRFTPTVKTLFNVISADIGRTITDIVFNFNFPDFKTTIQSVIETLIAKDIQITTQAGQWYTLRIMPYRTLENFINGVVLTFTNISPLKKLESKMDTLVSSMQSVVNMMPLPALLLNHKQQIVTANKAFNHFFELDGQDLTGIAFPVIVHEFWKTNRLDKMMKNLMHEKTAIVLDQDFPKIGRKHLSITSIPTVDKDYAETLMIQIVIEEK